MCTQYARSRSPYNHATQRVDTKHTARILCCLFRSLLFFLSLRCVNYFSYELQIKWNIYLFLHSLPSFARIELSAAAATAIFISWLRVAAVLCGKWYAVKKKSSEFEKIDATAESAICKSFICFVWPNGIACWLLCGLFDTYARFSLSCDVPTAATVKRMKSEWSEYEGATIRHQPQVITREREN